jgi:hypothetical protein
MVKIFRNQISPITLFFFVQCVVVRCQEAERRVSGVRLTLHICTYPLNEPHHLCTCATWLTPSRRRPPNKWIAWLATAIKERLTLPAVSASRFRLMGLRIRPSGLVPIKNHSESMNLTDSMKDSDASRQQCLHWDSKPRFQCSSGRRRWCALRGHRDLSLLQQVLPIEQVVHESQWGWMSGCYRLKTIFNANRAESQSGHYVRRDGLYMWSVSIDIGFLWLRCAIQRMHFLWGNKLLEKGPGQ